MPSYGGQAQGGRGRAPPGGRRAMNAGTILALAAVAAACVVYMDGGRHLRTTVGTESDGAAADVLLTKPHDLHFANTLREPAEVNKGVTDVPHEQLVEAKMNADKAMRQNKSRKGQQESMEAREEANLKDELDEDTKKKQALELKDEVNHQDLKGLLSMDKEADSAKHLKVSSGKGALKASADAREEAALRSKLNAEVKAKQQQLFTQGESSVVMKGGVHSIARARALDGKQKLSEAQLEAQLRASLNAKVSTEQKQMYKSALQTYLASSSGVSNMDKVVSTATGNSQQATVAQPTAVAKAGGGSSSSLQAAERIMKMSLRVSKGPHPGDTTLQHPTLARGRVSKAQEKKDRLAALEAAMLKSTMDAAKRDAPEIAKRDAAKAKVEQKRLEADEAAKKPSYNDAMMAFGKRLVHSEKRTRAKLMPKHETLAEAGTVNKARLEAAIKRKVAERLAKGSAALEAERAQLAKQFSGAHSLFGKAEQSELASLKRKRHVQLSSDGVEGGSSWTL